MSFAEVLLDLPEEYGAIITLFYGAGINPITGLYTEEDSKGNRRPLTRIELGQRIIDSATLTTLLDFYNTYQSSTGFRFRNWLDYTLDTVELAFNANEALTLQMAKSYTVSNVTTYKAIHKPVVGGITVTASGVPLVEGVDYTIDYTTGILQTTNTFQGYIWVSGVYDTPVCFDFLPFTYTEVGPDQYQIGSLVLLEIPYEPSSSANMPPPLLAPIINDVTLPQTNGSLVDTSFEDVALDYDPTSGISMSTVGIHQVAASSLSLLGLPADYSNIFYVGSVKAASVVSATLLELRRMMPFGMKWFSLHAVDNIASIIGSMLFAEADMYYAWALSMFAIENQRSPLTVKFEYAQQWFELLFGRAVLGSDGFLRKLMELYTKFDNQDASSYVAYLNEFYGIESSVSYPTVPSFSVYDFNSSSVEGGLTYTEPNNVINLSNTNGQLNETEFYTVMFKRQDSDWVEREVPGFPIPLGSQLPNSVVVDAATYLQNPQEGMLVIDDDVLIYPLHDFLMRLNIDLGDQVPYDLNWTTDHLMPAGLLVNYRANSVYIGDW